MMLGSDVLLYAQIEQWVLVEKARGTTGIALDVASDCFGKFGAITLRDKAEIYTPTAVFLTLPAKFMNKLWKSFAGIRIFSRGDG